MFMTIEDFKKDWQQESSATAKILEALTDASLNQAPSNNDRNLGRMAWHIVVSIPEMLSKTGITPKTVSEHTPIPTTATEMAAAYRRVAEEAITLIADQWTDETLNVSDDMYGMRWKRGETLEVLIRHEIHHRGQITVLMRMAGLRVPGIYGPAREDWANMGMEPPAI